MQTQTRPIRIIMIGAPRQLPEREHLAWLDDQLLHPAGDHLQIVRFVVLVLNIIPAVRIDQSLGTFILDIRQPFFGLPAGITISVMLHFLIKTPNLLFSAQRQKKRQKFGNPASAHTIHSP